MSLQTLIDKSTKRMGAVHPVVKVTALEMIKRAFKEGINVLVTDGYRSMEEQAKIYGKGRKSYIYKGKDYGVPSASILSNAKPGSSNHNYGLAIDFVLCNEDASKVYYMVNAEYKRVAAIAKALGFAWGGDWTGFKDYPHLEMMGGLTLNDLKNGKYPKLVAKFTPISEAAEKLKEDKKESVRMYKPSNDAMLNSTITVLKRLEGKENGISSVHRERLSKGQLSLDDAVGLIYVAIERGLILR